MAFTKGQNLTIEIDGEEYNAHLKDVRLEPDDGDDADFVTFATYTTGDTEKWYLRGSGYQDYAADSLWTKAWTASGTIVPFVLAPHGNTVASASQPHFTGTVRISRKPVVGGEVGEPFEFDVEWEIEGVPLRVTA
jgi:hypothetical protein